MASQIQLTRSGSTGVQPAASELEYGELALNYADGKLFYKDDQNALQQLNDTYKNSNNTIFVNSIDTHIGLKTTSPEYLLDLGGAVSTTDNTLRINQTTGGTAIRIGSDGVANGEDITLLRVDNLDGETNSAAEGFAIKYLGTNSNNELGIFTDNGSSELQALTILQNGNVGIGTGAPTVELDVAGQVHLTNSGTIGQNSANLGNATLRVQNDSTNLYIDANEIVTDHDLHLQSMRTSGNINFTCNNSSGNQIAIANVSATGFAIGKGATAATTALDVVGSANFASNDPNIVLQKLNADDGQEQTRLTIGTDNSTAAFEVQTATSTGTFVSNDYRILKNASGATNHEFRIGNGLVVEIDSTGASSSVAPTAVDHLTRKDYVDQSGIPNIVQAISSKRVQSAADLPGDGDSTAGAWPSELSLGLWPDNALKAATDDRAWATINKYPLYASITPRRTNSMFRITVNAFGGVQGDDGCGVIVAYNTGSYSHGTAPTGLAETVVGNSEGQVYYRNTTFHFGNADDGSDKYEDSGHWNGLWTPSSSISAGTTVNFFLSVIGLNDDNDRIMFNGAYEAATSAHHQGVYPTNIMIEEIFTQ